MDRILIFTIFLSLFLFSCGKDEKLFNNSSKLLVFYKTKKLPKFIDKIEIKLISENSEKIIKSITPRSSNDSLIVFECLNLGKWKFEAKAFGSNSNLLYKGETYINSIDQQTLRLDLSYVQLNEENGSISFNLSIGDSFSGWKDYNNNPILTPFAELQSSGITGSLVYYENNRFYMLYNGLVDGGNSYIFLAESRDGLNWESYLNEPVLYPSSDGWDSKGVCTGALIKIGNKYHLYYQGYKDSKEFWNIGLATSSDFKNWSKNSTPILFGDENEKFIHPSDIIKYNDVYFLFYSAKNEEFNYKIGIATSKDAFNFVKYEGNPILNSSLTWEGNGVFYASIKMINNSYVMFYNNAQSEYLNWGFGRAISKNLVDWEKIDNEPIFKTTDSMVSDLKKITYPRIIFTENISIIYYTAESNLGYTIICAAVNY